MVSSKNTTRNTQTLMLMTLFIHVDIQ